MIDREPLATYLDTLDEYPVFLAYNSNVDAITTVDQDLAAALDPPMADPPAGPIDSAGELSRLIADAMERGEGDLVAMTDEFGQWLTDALESETDQLGGQAGIMADLLSVVGAGPVLYTYLLTERQRSMFSDPAAIDFPVLEDGAIETRPMSEVTNADHTKVNWIFEFPEGSEFHDARAVTDSRFIAAARPERVNLETGLEDVAADLGNEVDCALLSGIHSLKLEYEDGTTYADRLERGRTFVRNLRSESDVPVQMEYGVTHKEDLRLAIAEEFAPEMDAIGMDGRELDFLAEDLGLGEAPPSEDVVATYELMETVREELGVDCLKLHHTHYFLTVTSGDYLSSDALRRGWDFASIVAAAKATTGTIADRDGLERGLEVGYSETGRERVAALAEHLDADVEDDALTTERVVAHPNRVVDDPQGTVGLGDAVCASNFALEQALADKPEQEVVQ